MTTLQQPHPLLLASPNVQVNTPRRIPAALLKPFQQQLQDVVLLPRQRRHGIPATLAVIHDTYLVADTPQAVSLMGYTAEVLLVIFPVLPTQNYVVQTWIDNLYLDRVKLRYQDPRYDRRWNFPGVITGTLRVVPPAVATAVTQAGGLTRDMTGLSRQGAAGGAAAITEMLTPPEQLAPDEAAAWAEASPPLPCRLRDLSLGGVGLTVQGTPPPELDVQGLVQLDLTVPGRAATEPAQAWHPVHLCLYGAVRRINMAPRMWTVHLRFLQRLPAVLESHFAAVAEYGPTSV
jgi:hypothetical protein